MTFQRFSALNMARCRDGFKHEPGDWSASDWMVATMGELGEAANVLKKLNRERDGVKGNTETADALRTKLASEIADTFVYLDLMSQALGIDLESAVRRTFDAKSRQIGYQHLIDRDDTTPPARQPLVNAMGATNECMSCGGDVRGCMC